jgi:DNA-binding GntR family transcriptional regulator
MRATRAGGAKRADDAAGPLAAASGSTAALLAERLRGEITGGRLEPGAPLRQDEVAARYGVSRIPVREALRALQAEGLVSYEPNRGATVATFSLDDVLEMLEVRIALECHALRLAVPRMGGPDMEAAAAILAAYDEARDAAAWAEMNWRFHATLYAPCDCRRLLKAVEENYGQSSIFARRYVSAVSGKERPQREHHRLLRLARDGKAEEAAVLLEDHIRDTQRSLRAAGRRRGA